MIDTDLGDSSNMQQCAICALSTDMLLDLSIPVLGSTNA